ADHIAAKATDCIRKNRRDAGRPRGRRKARGRRTARNRRDPTRRLTASGGRPYKPRGKGAGAGGEAEGPGGPVRAATTTPFEGRGPALVALVRGDKHEGMAR